jgi:hypothetical protein
MGYLIVENLKVRRTLANIGKEKEKEFSLRFKKQKELIKKDWEEKYRQEMLFYEETAKKLELEKKQVKELEERLKDLPKDSQKVK